MNRARALTAGLLAGALAVTLSACGPDSGPGSTGGKTVSITVGSLQSSQSQLVAQLYGQVLAHEGYDVSYNPGVGARAAYLTALQEGVVDIVPETVGSLLSTLDSSQRYSDPSVIATAVRTYFDDQELPLHLLEPAPAQDAYSFVMTKDFARTHNIVTLRDLAPIAPGVSIGGLPGFDALPIARTGLDRVYGVRDWEFVPFESDTTAPLIDALIADTVQVVAISSASTDIIGNDLVVLGDPSGLIVAQNIAPVVNDEVFSERVERTLNDLSKTFTTSDLRELTAAGEKRSYENAAREWLLEHGFLE